MNTRGQDQGKTVLLDGRDAVRLGAPLGNPGGEGAVYRVDGRSDIAVKIFPKPSLPNPEKIRWLAKCAGARLTGATVAWPVAPVYMPAPGGIILCGIAIPIVHESVSFEDLSNPQLRNLMLQRKNATLDLKQLHQIVRNLVEAVEHVHQKGVVFSDLNPKNILVDFRTCHVTLIDMDSALIATGALRNVRARHAYDNYLAPELLTGADTLPSTAQLANRDRTEATDSFVVGIHCFSLLLGAYPYQFRKTAGTTPSLPTHGLVLHGVFPYGPNVPAGYAPPAGEEQRGKFSWLHPELRQAFLNCFVAGHRDPSRRPGDADWTRALDRAISDLTKCKQGHWHSKTNGRCPRCASSQPSSAATTRPISPTPTPSPQPAGFTGTLAASAAGAAASAQSAATPTGSRSASRRLRSIEVPRRWAVTALLIISVAAALLLAPGPTLTAGKAGVNAAGWTIARVEDGAAGLSGWISGGSGDDVDAPTWQSSDSPNGGNSTYVIDGDPETVWTAAVSDSGDTWVQVDLGAVIQIHTIRWLIPESGAGAEVELLVSNNKQNWTTVRTITLGDEDVGQLRNRRLDARGRYVRLVIRDWPERGVAGEIAELDILTPADIAGADRDGAAGPVSDPTRTPAVSTAAAPDGDAGSAAPARTEPNRPPAGAAPPSTLRPEDPAPTIAPKR